MQEMGFDSIPFEEPELFRVRNGLQAGFSVTNKEQSSLDLTLDSQDLADASLEQASLACTALSAPCRTLSVCCHCSWSSMRGVPAMASCSSCLATVCASVSKPVQGVIHSTNMFHLIM